MKKEFEVEGSVYSEYKMDFKRILKKHGLRWIGSMGNFQWTGESDKVTAYFDRDEQEDMTIRARIVWEGKKKTGFLGELAEWVKAVEGKPVKARKPSKESRKEIQKELEFWDKLNEPPVEKMEADGRPESWIKKDVEEWKEKRKRKRKELLRKYS